MAKISQLANLSQGYNNNSDSDFSIEKKISTALLENARICMNEKARIANVSYNKMSRLISCIR